MGGSCFPILATLIDRCTGCVKKAPLTKAHVLHMDVLINMKKEEGKEGHNEQKLQALQIGVVKLKRLLMKTLTKHSSSGLFTQKF